MRRMVNLIRRFKPRSAVRTWPSSRKTTHWPIGLSRTSIFTKGAFRCVIRASKGAEISFSHPQRQLAIRNSNEQIAPGHLRGLRHSEKKQKNRGNVRENTIAACKLDNDLGNENNMNKVDRVRGVS